MLRPSDFFWICLIAFAFISWWRTNKVKQIAYRVAKRHCLASSIQFLDDSVVLAGFRLKRSQQSGRICLMRTFRFEFATVGDERYKGEVVLLGFRLQSVTLEPHKIETDPN